MAAPLSGRRIVSFLLFFGGSVLGALVLARYLNIDIFGAFTGKHVKKELEEIEESEKPPVSGTTEDNEAVDNFILTEIIKAANIDITVPQPDLADDFSAKIERDDSPLPAKEEPKSSKLDTSERRTGDEVAKLSEEDFTVENKVKVRNYVEGLVRGIVEQNFETSENGTQKLSCEREKTETHSPPCVAINYLNRGQEGPPAFRGDTVNRGDSNVGPLESKLAQEVAKTSPGVNLTGKQMEGEGLLESASLTEQQMTDTVLESTDGRSDYSTSEFSLIHSDEARAIDSPGGDEDLSLGAVLVGREDDDAKSPTPNTISYPPKSSAFPTEMDIRETFAIVQQYGGGALTDKHARVLVHLLASPSDDDVINVLNVIQNCAAFTSSQNQLREAGCLAALRQALNDVTMTSSTANKAKMAAVNGAIANLSVNEENQKSLQECIPSLIDLLSTSEPDRATCLSGLRALTNLSTSQQYHGSYTRAVQELYSLLCADDSAISRQAASVLVNLSTNNEMVPYLLAAKAPDRGVHTLLSTDRPDFILRLTTFLANITSTVHQLKLEPSQLPVDDKAASPETMYTALYGVDNMKVKSKVFVLLQHENEEISQNAKRTYTYLSGS